MEWLKNLLGDELYQQVQGKLEGSNVKLADLSTGEYVAKGKYEAEANKNKALQDNITELTDKVKGFDGVDIEALKAQATSWEEKYNADIQKMKLDNGIEKALMQSKAKSIKALKGLLDLDKITLEGEEVKGISEQLEALKQSESWMFDDGAPQTQTTGLKIDNPSTSLTREQIKKMTPSEINANWDKVQEVLKG